MDRIAEPLVPFLVGIGGEELLIFVDRLGDDPEAQLLRLPRLAVDVEGEALLRRVGQPFVDGDAVALGLRDLLAILVEEELVIEAFGRPAAEDPGDLRALGDRIDQVLARHLVIDPERHPAHRPVDLPLQLGAAGEDRLLDLLAGRRIDVAHQPRLRVHHLDRDLEHLAAFRADREDRRVGPAPFLAQGREHHVHDRAVSAQHLAQRLVEPAGPVAVGRGEELVVEAEAVEELREADCCCARHSCRGRSHRDRAPGSAAGRDGRASCPGAGTSGRDLAHSVHVVGESDQPARPVDHLRQGVADHQGPGHFLEGAEMGQPARAVAGLEDDRRPTAARPGSASGACALPHKARPSTQAAAARSSDRFHVLVHGALLAERGRHLPAALRLRGPLPVFGEAEVCVSLSFPLILYRDG